MQTVSESRPTLQDQEMRVDAKMYASKMKPCYDQDSEHRKNQETETFPRHVHKPGSQGRRRYGYGEMGDVDDSWCPSKSADFSLMEVKEHSDVAGHNKVLGGVGIQEMTSEMTGGVGKHHFSNVNFFRAFETSFELGRMSFNLTHYMAISIGNRYNMGEYETKMVGFLSSRANSLIITEGFTMMPVLAQGNLFFLRWWAISYGIHIDGFSISSIWRVKRP